MKLINILAIPAGLIVSAVRFFKNLGKKPTPIPSTSTPAGPAPTTGTSKSVLRWKKQFTDVFGAVLLAGTAYVVWYIYRAWNAITGFLSDFRINWFITGAILVVAVLVVGLTIYSKRAPKEKDKDKDKKRQEQWKVWRNKMGFAALWTAIIVLINVMLWHMESGFWRALWEYKSPETWFFYLIMALLTTGIWLAVNMEDQKVKACGKILFGIGMLSWLVVYWQTPDVADVPPPPVVAKVIVPSSPSDRWSAEQTFHLKRNEWSVPLVPIRYEAEEGLVEIMVDGKNSHVLKWNVKSMSPDVVQITVPAYAKFIQLRSVEKDITVYGTPKS